jgi:hypothetical protein
MSRDKRTRAQLLRALGKSERTCERLTSELDGAYRAISAIVDQDAAIRSTLESMKEMTFARRRLS